PFKFRKFYLNKGLVLISSIFFIHALGLLYTDNMGYALADMRIKLPLLVIPILFAGMPHLKKSGTHFLIKVFAVALLISTLFSFGNILLNKPEDLRDGIMFISHIRLGLMISFCLIYFVLCWAGENKIWKTLFIAMAGWFLLFMFYTHSATGILTFGATFAILALIWSLRNWNKLISKLAIPAILIIGIVGFLFLKNAYDDYFTLNETKENLDEFTENGEPYYHIYERTFIENGFFTDIYIAPKELELAWNNSSVKDFKGLDNRGQNIESTVRRYMTSKGLRKDANGVSQLTEQDIKNIENGFTNVNEPNRNAIDKKLNELFYEWTAFENGADPSGNSLFMRTEFWKNGWSLFKKNKWFGVGTGDIKDELDKEYEKNQTLLDKDHQYRVHNQYLAFAICFGIIGLLAICFCMYYPIITKKADLLFLAFIIIYSLSFLTEDTLETQAGVTFFAFFSSFFLSQWRKDQSVWLR
ncbi:MAG: O-antigen ligase family protein, partial [Flavobacteriales bacterium]|nr:O-antigen ligase family protein [Flavobacteriales bacterium]